MLTSDEYLLGKSFAETAEAYCWLVEDACSQSADGFLRQTRRQLPMLFARAMELPNVSLDNEEAIPAIAHDRWTHLVHELSGVLGQRDLHLLDPSDLLSGHVSFLADDLADIWRDTKGGLEQWSSENELGKAEAVWHWKFSFETHWSYHLVNAMRAIELQRPRMMSGW
ncbi:MAG: DUF5063 domain-containing protein [Planctomycetota bacterium]